MTLYVLDTDMLTLIEEGHSVAGRRFLEQPSESVAITVLSVEEQLSGWYTQVRKAKRPERLAWAYSRLAETVRFLARVRILNYDEAAMKRYEEFRKRKVKMSRMDMRIAATTMEHGAVLVTRNVRDFERIPGIQLEDWSS